MKKRVSILIEEDVIRHAKMRAAEEGRSLSDLTQDALVSYLSGKVPDPRKREEAYRLFIDRPMRLSREQFREILEVDGNE
jgi:plasmid stability protein